METNLILEGFKFMGLGMGTVLLFLVIMIVCMNIMSYIVHRFFPEPATSLEPSVTGQKDNKKIIAAISAAISHHRQG
ncbi:MAG: oxaloacetate decarboxylase gamma subunit [Sulfurimonas sp.]|jgi:oxaloacetate decarboxylase gamma subunit